MALPQDAKNYGNRPRLRGKHMRSGPLADVIREIGSPGLTTLSASFAHTDFEATSETDTVTLATLPKGAEILKVIIDLKADFTASAGANTTLSLGVDSSAAAFGRALEVQHSSGIAVGRHVWTPNDDQGPDEVDSSTSEKALKITCSHTGSTCNLLTAGSFAVSVLYAVIP